jgi:hypothetical protein
MGITLYAHHRLNSTKLIWFQIRIYYSSIVGRNGFEMKAVKKNRFVCFVVVVVAAAAAALY